MRDPDRIDRILEKLGALWKQYPDQRLGQLLSNFIYQTEHDGRDVFLFYPEDDVAEAHIDMYLEDE